MLSQIDVQNRKLAKTIFGSYKKKDIELFKSDVYDGIGQYVEEIEKLREELSKVRFELDRYKHMEANLTEALVLAKKTAEEVIQNAKRAKEAILIEAKNEVESTKRSVEQEVFELRHKKSSMENEIISFKTRVKSILESQLENLERLSDISEI